MRQRSILAVLTLLSACTTNPARELEPAIDAEERAAVLRVVQEFFDVIESADAEAGERILIPEGAFVSVRRQEGARVLAHFTNAESLEGLAADSRSMHEAFDAEPLVLIDGDVAVVWGRYRFHVDGELSHLGRDAFQLVRTDQGWKLAGGAYTVER